MGIESDVHWGYDLDFDPWPHVQAHVCQIIWPIRHLVVSHGPSAFSKEENPRWSSNQRSKPSSKLDIWFLLPSHQLTWKCRRKVVFLRGSVHKPILAGDFSNPPLTAATAAPAPVPLNSRLGGAFASVFARGKGGKASRLASAEPSG